MIRYLILIEEKRTHAIWDVVRVIYSDIATVENYGFSCYFNKPKRMKLRALIYRNKKSIKKLGAISGYG